MPLLQAGSGSNTAMNVDMPQPLSARTSNLMRSPGRSLPAPSDPGLHSATAVPSAFTHAASLSAVQVRIGVRMSGAMCVCVLRFCTKLQHCIKVGVTTTVLLFAVLHPFAAVIPLCHKTVDCDRRRRL